MRSIPGVVCAALAALGIVDCCAQEPDAEASGSWALGLAAQVDQESDDSRLLTFNWGVTPKTWLSFAAGRSSSPADRADVTADTLVASVDQRFDRVDQRFAEVDRRFAALDARIAEEGQITRRHFDVVAEDLKREIRTLAATVAEGQRALNENRSEHRTFSAARSDHELRLMALEHRRRRQP